MYKNFILLFCVIVFLSLFLNPAIAEDVKDKLYDVDIESQPLIAAIDKLEKITSLEIIFFSEIADGATSTDISGQYTAIQAIGAMLVGTDLQVVPLSQSGSIGIKQKSHDENDVLDSQIINDQNGEVTDSVKEPEQEDKFEKSDEIEIEIEEGRVEMLDPVQVTGSRLPPMSPYLSPKNLKIIF